VSFLTLAGPLGVPGFTPALATPAITKLSWRASRDDALRRVAVHVVQGEAVEDDDYKPELTPVAETRPGADHCRSDGAQRDWADPVQYRSTRPVMINLMYAKCMCMYNKIRIFRVVFMSC
jgi:hypothetical protein